jgi:hypothetical protein
LSYVLYKWNSTKIGLQFSSLPAASNRIVFCTVFGGDLSFSM